jgi:hypothetical protein
MILYHFTHCYNLSYGEEPDRPAKGSILDVGLVPTKLDWGHLIAVDNVGVVWFTSDPQPAQIFLDGLPEFRIRVAIPERDPLLWNWVRFLRKCLPREQFEACRSCWVEDGLWKQVQTNWLYFGPVPLARFRAVEYSDPKERAKAEAELRAA